MTRDRRTLVVQAVLVVVAGLVALWAAKGSGSPTLLGADTSPAFTSATANVKTGQGAAAALALPGPDDDLQTVYLRSVTPHFSANTAGATASVVICVMRDDATPIGSVPAAQVERSCRELRPVTEGTPMSWGDPRRGGLREYPLLIVTTTRPGEATIDRVTYDYLVDPEHGGASGIDHGEMDYTVKAE